MVVVVRYAIFSLLVELREQRESPEVLRERVGDEVLCDGAFSRERCCRSFVAEDARITWPVRDNFHKQASLAVAQHSIKYRINTAYLTTLL